MRIYVTIIFAMLFFSCQKEKKVERMNSSKLKVGTYRAELTVKDQKRLPFIFEVDSLNKLTIYNAEEEIIVDELKVINDSVIIKLPVFDAIIKAAVIENGNLKGYYSKGPKHIKVPFMAVYDLHFRYPITSKKHQPIAGGWEVTFSPNTPNSYKAKGIFKEEGDNKISGTFLTETGDYRFLEGALDKGNLKLSCFDGAHAFLFDGVVKNDSITSGMFYSGNTYSEPWVAVKNDNFELSDPNTLTYLKEGYNSVDFTFPDLEGREVSINDKRFKGKVIIVQIMGSWCPNCLDESKYLSKYYTNRKPDNTEVIALAFEQASPHGKAAKNLNRLKERLGIKYPILIAQTGSASKKLAAEKLPMLNHVLSYPTTLFIDKAGVVRKIHTGFNGPATGKKYIDFTKEFEAFVAMLSKE